MTYDINGGNIISNNNNNNDNNNNNNNKIEYIFLLKMKQTCPVK